MDDSPSNRYHSDRGPNNGSIVNLDSEATGIMVVDRPDLEGTDSREKRGRGREREVGGFKTVAEGKVKGEEEEESVSSDSSEEDEEVDEHRLLSASFHAKAVAAVRGGAGGGGKSTGGASVINRANLSDSWNDEDLDPFSYGPPLTKWDYFKVSINALWLLPLRLIFIVLPSTLMGALVCTLALCGCDRFDEDNPQPLNRWGRFVMNYLGKIVTRVFLFGFGFNWIRTRGQPAPTKDAPVLVVSPHSTLLDMFIVSLYKVPTYVARADIRNIPLFGKLITRTLRTIYVEREDPESRMKAAEEIRRRTHTRGEWPKVLIFPEGTTTNRTAIISFKQGAFLPRLPVQPVLMKFKNRMSTAWADEDWGLIKSLFLTLCTFHNSLEVEFLPVYHPSDEETSNPKLYARNVQILMARTLGVPYTNHALEDMLLMRSATQAGLPPTSGIVVYRNVNQDLQMDLKAIKKWLRRFAAMDADKDGFVRVGDFAGFLQLPNDACVQAVFTAADKARDGKLNFRNYLNFIVGKARPLLQDASFMQAMFNFFDRDGDGLVSRDDLSRQLPIKSLPVVQERHSRKRQQPMERLGSDVSYQNPEGTVPEEMNLEQFTSLLTLHPEYALVFYECQHAGVSSPPSCTADDTSVTNGNSIATPTQTGGLNGQRNGHTAPLITLS